MEARSFFENSPMQEITVSATKEEWIQVIEKSFWIPDSALKDGDAFSKLIHWLINQGVYED